MSNFHWTSETNYQWMFLCQKTLSKKQGTEIDHNKSSNFIEETIQLLLRPGLRKSPNQDQTDQTQKHLFWAKHTAGLLPRLSSSYFGSGQSGMQPYFQEEGS